MALQIGISALACPTNVESSLYLCLVRPILEYAYSRYQSVTDILQQLDWPILNERRNQMKLIMMYKIIHGLVFIQHSLPLTYSNLNNISRGHNHTSIQPATNNTSHVTLYMWLGKKFLPLLSWLHNCHAPEVQLQKLRLQVTKFSDTLNLAILVLLFFFLLHVVASYSLNL